MTVHLSDGTVRQATPEEYVSYEQERLSGVQISSQTFEELLSQPMGSRKPIVRADSSVAVLKFDRICHACNAGYGNNPPFPPNGKRCGGCANIYYCNVECQKKHWPTHKHECKKLSVDRKIAKQIV